GCTRQWFVLPPVGVEPRRSVLGELLRPIRVIRVPGRPGRDLLRGRPLDRLAPRLPCLPLGFLARVGGPERLELGGVAAALARLYLSVRRGRSGRVGSGRVGAL